ncbi:hypothetical protein M0813_06360 [Anaeramoeba flamelloides]|uniref:Protein TIC 214 n=1 Tax=Anaeramoeba flamelloides TaxID=1746091 RepID=A0ABQ8XFI1_9EUKA|nr:hypothetical protein M0813_06360 [Anaeramoeba flamelloides]
MDRYDFGESLDDPRFKMLFKNWLFISRLFTIFNSGYKNKEPLLKEGEQFSFKYNSIIQNWDRFESLLRSKYYTKEVNAFERRRRIGQGALINKQKRNAVFNFLRYFNIMLDRITCRNERGTCYFNVEFEDDSRKRNGKEESQDEEEEKEEKKRKRRKEKKKSSKKKEKERGRKKRRRVNKKK